MEMIKTQDLAFTYPGTEDQVNTRALRGVDVTIERGSFVVILGHNGSGKSTLAKTFNAVLLPSGGKVYVDSVVGKGTTVTCEFPADQTFRHAAE